jgi:hypothetical protein
MEYIGNNMVERFTKELTEVTFKGKNVKINSIKLNIKQGDVEGYFLSQSKIFAGGGGYIPCPIKFTDKYVCVMILKEKPK